MNSVRFHRRPHGCHPEFMLFHKGSINFHKQNQSTPLLLIIQSMIDPLINQESIQSTQSHSSCPSNDTALLPFLSSFHTHYALSKEPASILLEIALPDAGVKTILSLKVVNVSALPPNQVTTVLKTQTNVCNAQSDTFLSSRKQITAIHVRLER